MYIAKAEEIDEIFDFYKEVLDYMDTYGVRIGWNIELYPNYSFVEEMVNAGEMFVERIDGVIACAGAVNHSVNPEYDEVDWDIKGPKEKISTIHGLAVRPKFRGGEVCDRFIKEIEDYCRGKGDLAIHFDVIDINVPAHKVYIRNGYTDFGAIDMYYETVGTRKFNMMEKVLNGSI